MQNTLTVKLKAFTAISLITFSLNANAALIDNNLHTYDNVSGLNWLDLTETSDFSYDFVSSELGAGGTWEGYRYATTSEVMNIFEQVGIASTQTTYNAAIIDPNIDYLQSLLSNTTAALSVNYIGSLGLANTGESGGEHSRLGAYYSISSETNYFNLSVGSYTIADNTSAVYIGHYLVQEDSVSPVPIPAAVWLFGSGLLGLVSIARRK